MGGKNWKGGGQRYHKGRGGRIVQPGVSGFLFTTTTGPIDKAKREVENLLTKYVPLAKPECDFPPTEQEREEAAAAARDEEAGVENEQEGTAGVDGGRDGGFSVASMLMAELNEVRTGDVGQKRDREGIDEKGNQKKKKKKPQLGVGDHWRLMESNCKGYLFYGIDAPPKEGRALLNTKATEAETEDLDEDKDIVGKEEEVPEGEDAPPQKRQRTEGENPADLAQKAPTVMTTTTSGTEDDKVADTSGDSEPIPWATDALKRFPLNWNVDRVSECMIEDLMENPAMVSRFTFKMCPVVATCNPTPEFILPIVRAITDEEDIPEGKSAIKGALSFFVRNNTTIEKNKTSLRSRIEKECFPMNKFFLVYPQHADVLITVAVMHSTCCIAVSRNYVGRMEYNLNKISQRALDLSTLVAAGANENHAADNTVPAEGKEASAIGEKDKDPAVAAGAAPE